MSVTAPAPTEDRLTLRNARNQPSALKDHFFGLGHAAAFLVCGGRSLESMPVDRLRDRGIASMGINNVVGFVRCTMFVCGDEARRFHHGIWLDPSIWKFTTIPVLNHNIRAKRDSGFVGLHRQVRHCPNVWSFEHDGDFVAADFLTRNSISWGTNEKHGHRRHLPNSKCTMLYGLRLLYHLGFRQVFMLGVDFQMQPDKPYAFDQKKSVEGCESNNLNFRHRARMLAELKPYFDAAGYQVWNCNPQSALEVFPYRSFDDALAIARNDVPQEPFDLEGWYDGKNVRSNHKNKKAR